MNKELAKALRQIIESNGGLNFVEKMFGTVQTVEKTEEASGTFIKKRFPVATEHISENCLIRNEEIASPDSSLRGILYFEDNGTAKSNKILSGNQLRFDSRLRLVCWINRNKVKADAYIEISGLLIADILNKLSVDRIISEVGFFRNLKTEVVSIPPQNANIFSAYSYDESVNQYLRPPFEFFAIDLKITYSVNPNCIEEIEIIEKEC